MEMLLVYGARSRLAHSVLAEAERDGRQVALVARDPAEKRDIESWHPQALVRPAWEDRPRIGGGGMSLVCCALGLAHPGSTRIAADTKKLEADLESLRRVLVWHRHEPVHLVFVSSIVALAPPRRHAYFGGWKNTIESAIGTVLTTHPRARWSVMFPGQLVERRDGGPLSARLATPYPALARRILKALDRGHTGQVVVGMDARLWLGGRALGLITAGIFGRP